MLKSFRYRALEMHHGLDLHPAEQGSHQRMIAMLDHAARLGLNRAYISEQWPLGLSRLVSYRDSFPELASGVDQADVEGRRTTFEAIVEHAGSHRISVFAGLNVANYPTCLPELFPDCVAEAPPAADRCFVTQEQGKAKVCFDNPAVKRLLQAQFEELLALPGIAGVSCWLNMADTDLFYCNCEQCRSKKISDMVAEFVNHVYPFCEDAGKTLIIRPYLGNWRCGLENKALLEALPRLPRKVEIIYKQQQGDMYNEHPRNELIGCLLPHKEHIEFDTYGEYRGASIGVLASKRKQIHRIIKYAYEEGVTGTVVRGLHFVHEFSLDADLFGALAQNPYLDLESWSQQWCAKRFGEAGDKVLSLLDRAGDVCRLAMYANGVNWASWSIPQNLYRLKFILFDRSAPCVINADERLKPTTENIYAISRKHKKAIRLADEMVETCSALKGKLAEPNFSHLLNSCRILAGYTRVVQPLLETVFRFFQWEHCLSEVEREYKRVLLLELLTIAKGAVKQAETDFGQIKEFVAAPIELVAIEPEEKLLQVCRNARQILADIEREMDTRPASYASVYPWPERWLKE